MKGPADSIRKQGAMYVTTPLNVAFAGGGKGCCELLQLLDRDRRSRLQMEILGVCDSDPAAPGLRMAEQLGLFTTTRDEDLFTLPGLDLIIELTGSPEVREHLSRKLPPHISLMDHKAARLLWDLLQVERENFELKAERLVTLGGMRKRTQDVLDSLPYRIMVVNRDLTIETVNRTFLREHALSEEEVLGKHCYKIEHGLDKPCSEYGRECYIPHGLEELKEKGLISSYVEYLDEKGETLFDVVTVAPICSAEGEILGIVEASRDVSTRMRLEREYQKSSIFLEAVIQSTVDGIVVVNTKGKVLIFNKGMEQLTGYSPADIVDRGHISNFYNMDVARENMTKMRSDRFGPPGKLHPTSMTITDREGREIPVTLTASIITIDNKEVGSVGIFTDMREILKMRKELESANIQLIQSQKIASVGRMAAGVAHEINNPLSAILIYAELLKEQLAGRKENLEDVTEIITQTMRCKKIVSDLLEFSRKSAGRTSSFSLEGLLRKCLDLLVHKEDFQNIQVTVQIEEDMPQTIGDMSQLQQVFTNLIMNAADAMEGRGRIEVRAGFLQEEKRFRIQVLDTGPGIPEEIRDKVFDIFFTTKPVGKGTGLGLSISQNIVKIHGGSITFHCPPEGGTAFLVDLPASGAATTEEEPVFIGDEPGFPAD
jgi:two-component system, NtrC family, sensor kinase